MMMKPIWSHHDPLGGKIESISGTTIQIGDENGFDLLGTGKNAN